MKHFKQNFKQKGCQCREKSNDGWHADLTMRNFCSWMAGPDLTMRNFCSFFLLAGPFEIHNPA